MGLNAVSLFLILVQSKAPSKLAKGNQPGRLMTSLLHGSNTVIFVEIDEHQHCHYGTSCEVSRMAKTVESMRCDGNSSAIYFVRYNPATHTCKVNGIRQIIDEKKSLQALCTFVRSLVDKRERENVYTIYFNYDSQETRTSKIYLKDLKTLPVIFEEGDYEHSVKEWLFVNICHGDSWYTGNIQGIFRRFRPPQFRPS